MLDNFGLITTFISLALNMFIVWVSLIKADSIMKFMGSGGTRAFAKIMYILLAAIAVMMIRRGIVGAFLK
jgi:multiple antibiotic resistance protein